MRQKKLMLLGGSHYMMLAIEAAHKASARWSPAITCPTTTGGRHYVAVGRTQMELVAAPLLDLAFTVRLTAPVALLRDFG